MEKEDLMGGAVYLTLEWKDTVCHAKEIVFCGASFEKTRPMYLLFIQKRSHDSLFCVFKHAAMEYWGDANASSQLYVAYCKQKSKMSEPAFASVGCCWKEKDENINYLEVKWSVIKRNKRKWTVDQFILRKVKEM